MPLRPSSTLQRARALTSTTVTSTTTTTRMGQTSMPDTEHAEYAGGRRGLPYRQGTSTSDRARQPDPARRTRRLYRSPLHPVDERCGSRGSAQLRAASRSASDPDVGPWLQVGGASCVFRFDLGGASQTLTGYRLAGDGPTRCSCRSSTRRAVARPMARAVTSTCTPSMTGRTRSTNLAYHPPGAADQVVHPLTPAENRRRCESRSASASHPRRLPRRFQLRSSLAGGARWCASARANAPPASPRTARRPSRRGAWSVRRERLSHPGPDTPWARGRAPPCR